MLYITGDYYDVNAVWQTNVTSDVNVIYQLQNQPSADLMALHPDGTLTQSVSTGGNELTNDAAIVDVNPDVIYVDGHVYTDSILVQANLLPTDQDGAVNGRSDALVTELIAFVDDARTRRAPLQPTSHHRCRQIRWRVCCTRGRKVFHLLQVAEFTDVVGRERSFGQRWKFARQISLAKRAPQYGQDRSASAVV